MKTTRLRFILFCMVALFLVFIPISKPIFNYFGDENVSYYFYAKKINKDINASVTKCGNAYIIQCDLNTAKDVKNNISEIESESIRIKNYKSQTYQKILEKYKSLIVKSESIDGISIFLCYDQSLPNFFTIDGQKTNTQIAISDSEINIGYPIILNGY